MPSAVRIRSASPVRRTLVALVTVLALAAGTTATAAAAPPTEIDVVKPYGPIGLLDKYSVSHFVRGTCFAGSIASSRRPTAWRCTAGNEILDPCFLSPNREHGFLACFPTPWSTRVVGLQLTKPLPDGEANRGYPPRGLPWGIVLASGSRCVLDTGTAAIVDGVGFEYGCTGGGGLAGSPDRHRPAWTIRYARHLGSSPIVRATIRSAWY